MDCKTVEQKLPFYFYEELTAEEQAQVQAHLAACARCAAAAEELGRLRAALDQRPAADPSPELFVECRQGLEDALDRETAGWREWLRGWLGPAPLPAALRATTVLGVLVLGFSLGWTLQRQTAIPTAGAPGSNGQAPWVGANLDDVRIRGISQVTPNPQTGEVRITLNAERRMILEGSLDDPRIRQVLLYAVKSYDNPGIRRDSLESLRERSETPFVRDALVYAVEHDPNAGVRLQALEALRGVHCSVDLHRALLDRAEREANAGVRFAAVDLLIKHALEEGDEKLFSTLKKLAVGDRNPYVRLKCARAVRESAREEF